MNERIKELLDEATVYALHETKDAVDFLDNPVSKQQRELQLEKFAELIIRECAGVDLYWLSEQDRKAVAEKMKQHFGVEE